MIVTPIIRYKAPHYPDKQTAMKDPLLLKNLPRRWAGRAATVTAVTATAAMMLTGCAVGEESSDAGSIASVSAASSPASSLPVSVAISSVAAAASSKPVSAVSVAPVIINDKIAPLFIHGAGRGGFGCTMVAPSVYLTEEEAFSIIAEMLAQEGVTLSAEAPSVEIQLPKLYFASTENISEYITGFEKGTLALDGIDSSGKIAYEFVSVNDLVAMKDKAPFDTSRAVGKTTFDYYNFDMAAQSLNEQLSYIKTPYAVATFYEPSTYNDTTKAADSDYRANKDREMYDQTLRTEREKDLRLQVADFITWLKAEEII